MCFIFLYFFFYFLGYCWSSIYSYSVFSISSSSTVEIFHHSSPPSLYGLLCTHTREVQVENLILLLHCKCSCLASYGFQLYSEVTGLSCHRLLCSYLHCVSSYCPQVSYFSLLCFDYFGSLISCQFSLFLAH
uniref:Uncharacterized protein n=1 Tax=Cacopsylla melanoneura TaxID=428564 RepID=A0A8D9BC37_9HEMI